MPSNGLLHDGLAYWARRTPDAVAATLDGRETITYSELSLWSDGIARHLQAKGARAGANVAIAAANSLAWVASAFAILKVGATISPFNDRLVAEELRYLAENSEACLIIADEERRHLFADAKVETPLVDMESLEDCRDGASSGWRPVRTDSDSVAMIIFTSGSTDRPKGAMMTHGNYLAKFLEMRLLDDRLGSATRSLMPFGLHSSPGLPWGIFFTTTLGGTLYFTSRYKAENILDLLATEAIDFFIGVPMIFEQVANLSGFAAAELSHLTFARIGGATPTPEIIRRWREKGVTLRQLYGMTEVGGGCLIANEKEAFERPDSCGRGLAFSRFKIVREDGSECGPNEPGNILLQGPGLMSGYWKKPEETAAALKDGWMHTGDIGLYDEDGYFKFLDRSKEMIKSGGFNVSPSEIECTIRKHPAIVEVAVFGIEDPDYAESIFAFASCDSELTQQELFDFCVEHMAGYKLPRFIEISRDRLPRLANEKVDRRILKQRFKNAARERVRLKALRPLDK